MATTGEGTGQNWHDELAAAYGTTGVAVLGWWQTLNARYLTPPAQMHAACAQLGPVVEACAGMHRDAAHRAVHAAAEARGIREPARLAAWLT